MAGGVKVAGTDDFRDFARRCRAAGTEGKGLLREIQRALKDGAEPVAEDARRNVRALSSQGGRGAARAQRTQFLIDKRKKRLTEGTKARIHASTGLRSSSARATKLQVTTSGSNAQARIRVQTSIMPPNQRKLPWHLNTGRWRHPVFGDIDTWVTQTAVPGQWFDRAMIRGGPKARDHAFKTVGQFLDRF